MLFCVIIGVLVSGLASACDFPYYMQTNITDRDWRTRVKQQFTQFPVSVTVEKNVMRTISTDPDSRSHTRVCLQNLGKEKFLVAHESSGQEGTRYTCVQFLQRTKDVVQLQEAEISTRMDSSLCHDSNLTLNPHILIDKNHILENKPVRCSLQGGFSVRIYDSSQYTGKCDSYLGQTRVESECTRGEGLTFYFRHPSCVPSGLYMFSTQHTQCLANWNHGAMGFMLLKHTSMQYMWTMRIPAALHDNFVAFVFHDLVADASSHLARKYPYIQLDSVRDVPIPRTSLCVDDYEMCDYFNRPCETDETALTCPRTCRLCNSTRPSLCSLNGKFMGQWYNAANPGTLALTVNTTFMTTFDDQGYQERFHCVDYDKSAAKEEKHTSTQMLVSEFNNGCKPRYSCVSFLQKASSILFMKLSEGKAWPFTTEVSAPVDCSNFAFKEDETLEPNMFKNDNYRLIYSRTSNSVPCELPSGLTNYAANFKDGNTCSASLVKNQLVNGFTVMLDNCPERILDTSHTCVESSRMLSSILLIITRSASDPDRIFCWVFPRGIHYQTFYLLEPSQCNESVRRKIRKNRVRALATFNKTRSGVDGPPGLSTAFVRPDVPTQNPLRPALPTGTTKISVGDRVGDGPTSANPGFHIPRDDDKFNDTASEASDDSGVASTAVPIVILAAIMFFIIFQIPCTCQS